MIDFYLKKKNNFLRSKNSNFFFLIKIGFVTKIVRNVNMLSNGARGLPEFMKKDGLLLNWGHYQYESTLSRIFLGTSPVLPHPSTQVYMATMEIQNAYLEGRSLHRYRPPDSGNGTATKNTVGLSVKKMSSGSIF